jgi:hypothetical protein
MRLAPMLCLPAVFALTACSSNVPANADAAWVVNFVSTGGMCSETDSTVQFGDPGNPTDGTVPSPVENASQVCALTNGNGNCPMGTNPPASAPVALVTCKVYQESTGFGVHASASIPAGTDSLQIDVDGLTTGASKASPVMGTVSYVSSKTVTAFTSSMCSFYFVAGGSEGVAAGKVWTAFTCAEFDSGQITGCTVSESYAAFENCDQSM